MKTNDNCKMDNDCYIIIENLRTHHIISIIFCIFTVIFSVIYKLWILLFVLILITSISTYLTIRFRSCVKFDLLGIHIVHWNGFKSSYPKRVDIEDFYWGTIDQIEITRGYAYGNNLKMNIKLLSKWRGNDRSVLLPYGIEVSTYNKPEIIKQKVMLYSGKDIVKYKGYNPFKRN